MTTFANVISTPRIDGLPYATAKVMPGLEGDLFNQAAPLVTPIPLLYGEAVSASIELSAQGTILTNATYVVLQTDFGDGVWYDVAWCVWTGTTGTANFLLSTAVSAANAFQQSRAVGTAPGSSGSNATTLGGRVRFVGKAAITASSSSSSLAPGQVPQINCTVLYKVLGLK